MECRCVTKLLAHLSRYGKKKENRQLNNRKADRQTDRMGKFKKLCCCVGEEYYKIILFYQLH